MKNFDPMFRDLMWVPRWTIVRTTRSQSVVEHSYYTTLYAIDIAKKTGAPVTAKFIEHCLKHDWGELHTGDMPGGFKRDNHIKEYNQYLQGLDISSEQKRALKLADYVEAAIFCEEESLLGNVHIEAVLADVKDNLRKLCDNEELYWDLWSYIEQHARYRGRRR